MIINDKVIEPTENTNGMTRIQFDFQKVHEKSVDVLTMMEDSRTEVSIGIVALALSLGRLLSPEILKDEEEVKFIQALIEFGGTYFAEGVPN